MNFKIEKGLNPIQIKDRMLELQGYLENVADSIMEHNKDVGVLEATLKYIKDISLLKLQDEKLNNPIREAKSKTEIKVEVNILEKGKRIKKKWTYHECNFVLVEEKVKLDRDIKYLEELKISIDVCKFYPVKGMI